MNKVLESGIFKRAISLKRNEFLKTQGSIDSQIYFIKSGSLKISVYKSHQEQIIRLGYEGNLIVALDSFIHERSSDYVIQAIKKSDILVATKKDFMEWVNTSPDHQVWYTQMLENLILQQLEREKDLLTDSPQERYQRVMDRNPQLFQIIPHKHIANYLRMSPETLSRLKKS